MFSYFFVLSLIALSYNAVLIFINISVVRCLQTWFQCDSLKQTSSKNTFQLRPSIRSGRVEQVPFGVNYGSTKSWVTKHYYFISFLFVIYRSRNGILHICRIMWCVYQRFITLYIFIWYTSTLFWLIASFPIRYTFTMHNIDNDYKHAPCL